MGTSSVAQGPRLSRWEANCLFCGAGLADEGASFLDHMKAAPACRDAYDAWLENLDHDWPGGG